MSVIFSAPPGEEPTCFHCIDSCSVSKSVVNPRFITSYYTGQHVVRGCQQFRTCFHPKLLLNGCWQTANVRPIWPRPCLNPDVHAKYSRRCHMKCPLLQDFQSSIARHSFSTAWQQSSLVTSTGRPARMSSSSDVRSRLNSATHLVTVE